MEEKTISIAADTLGSLLRRPYERLQARVYAGLAARGFPDVRPAHSSVFRIILPRGSRVSDLAELAQMTKQSMAYLINDLEKLGYVTIEPDPQDGRAKLVRLTERGHAVWATLVELSRRAEEDGARIVGAERIRELRRTLLDLDAALDRTS